MSPPASARVEPSSRSSSAIVADIASGSHDLSIDARSLACTGVRRLLTSCPFTVGGRRWRIQYYPDGNRAESAGHVSLYLLLDHGDEDVAETVTAQYRFSVVVEKKRALFFFLRSTTKQTVSSRPYVMASFAAGSMCWGYTKFTKRKPLTQLLRRHQSDRFTVRCDIVVHNGFRAVEAAETAASVLVPAPDLHRHLGDLLASGRGADVVFQVGGEAFAAHRCVLAARSPVFSAELFGAMVEGSAGAVVQVDDMEPLAFKALLCFAYTDSLPPEMGKEEEDVMYQHLLVAADRYDLERLKLICEDKLCKRIGVGTVETILALAEQHHCDVLKKACLDFLGARTKQLRAVIATHGR
ncbi:hypothetical protein ACP70R_021269 [Stipagrostis hirtigluma subsp. patula]